VLAATVLSSKAVNNGLEVIQGELSPIERIYGEMSKIRALVGVTAAVLMAGSAALLATATGASAQTPPVKAIVPFAGSLHPIMNAGHLPGDPAAPAGECLQPLTTDFRAPIVQRPCNGSSAQLWAVELTPSGGTHYRFLNTDGWCMSVDSVGNGVPVLQDECAVSGGTTVSNAEWNSTATIVANQSIVVSLHTRIGFVNSAHCLDEPGALAGNSNMQLFACNSTNAQRWLVNSN